MNGIRCEKACRKLNVYSSKIDLEDCKDLVSYSSLSPQSEESNCQGKKEQSREHRHCLKNPNKYYPADGMESSPIVAHRARNPGSSFSESAACVASSNESSGKRRDLDQPVATNTVCTCDRRARCGWNEMWQVKDLLFLS